MNRQVITILTFFLVIASFPLGAQELLRNPSFEGDPRPSSPPSPWINCSALSSADTQPGYWNVNVPAFDSATYVSLVARGIGNQNPMFDGTKERIGQKLTDPLKSDKRYQLSMRMMHSESFKYQTSTVPTQGSGNLLKLNVWLGYDGCGNEEQKVFSSPPIDTSLWQAYKVSFVSEEDYDYFTIEVDYIGEDTVYFGNILIDSFSLKRDFDSCEAFFPNVFTPNGDEINDEFGLEFDCYIRDFEMRIYNRWGQQVFVSKDAENRWDGRFKNDPQPSEVYTYYCYYTTVFEEEIARYRKAGNVTLLR